MIPSRDRLKYNKIISFTDIRAEIARVEDQHKKLREEVADVKKAIRA